MLIKHMIAYFNCWDGVQNIHVYGIHDCANQLPVCFKLIVFKLRPRGLFLCIVPLRFFYGPEVMHYMLMTQWKGLVSYLHM